MSVKYIGTDETDEGRIDWYEIDGVTYGKTSDDKILDSDGIPLVDDSSPRRALDLHRQAI